MSHSIRGRLVISYIFLSLLTVILVGLLATGLIMRNVTQQEMRSLQANAKMVAQQALPLMWPLINRPGLQELASTAAFMGTVQVRLLDTQGRVLADSGSRAGIDELVWIVPPDGVGGAVLLDPSGQMQAAFANLQLPAFLGLQDFPPGTKITIVQRREDLWANQFLFHTQWLIPTIGQELDQVEPARALGLNGEDQERTFDRVVSVPIGDTEAPLGFAELTNRSAVGPQAIAAIRQGFLIAAFAAILIAILVGLLISRWLSGPLRVLSEAAERMGEGDLSTRAPIHAAHEIGQLALRFNQMAEKLQTNFRLLEDERNALRRFIADTSHELRTPITALKNFNDLLLGKASEDPQVRQEFLVESQAQIERMEWMTQSLLDLSRFDAGLVAPDLTLCDVGELLDSAVAPFRNLAREKGIQLSVRPPRDAVSIPCDDQRIELALSNLLDNALKFTPSQGTVEVGAEIFASIVRIWVEDDGPGIDPADLPHIFERFYRGRNVSDQGNGLGLAIVQGIVHLHGGLVWVENIDGGGSRFVIELPIMG